MHQISFSRHYYILIPSIFLTLFFNNILVVLHRWPISSSWNFQPPIVGLWTAKDTDTCLKAFRKFQLFFSPLKLRFNHIFLFDLSFSFDRISSLGLSFLESSPTSLLVLLLLLVVLLQYLQWMMIEYYLVVPAAYPQLVSRVHIGSWLLESEPKVFCTVSNRQS